MARSEARLAVTLWSDPDFLALSARAQRQFMFLLSQPDLAHDGVIALRVRRWSKSAKGLTPAEVNEDLDELARARFIVIDDDAEELLIRSFIRRDKVFRQPNVLRAAADHLQGITSTLILREVHRELRRISEAKDIPAGSAAILAEMQAVTRKAWPQPSENPPQEGPQNPPEDPSGNPSVGTPGERGVSTTVTTDSPFPVPRAPQPRPRPSAGGRASADAREADAPAEPPSDRCRKHQDHDEPPPCGNCGEARRRRAAWDRQQATTAAENTSRAARERAAATAAAVAACNQCDHRGRLPDGILCAHAPDAAERTHRGAAAARAALAAQEVTA